MLIIGLTLLAFICLVTFLIFQHKKINVHMKELEKEIFDEFKIIK